jgi:hypothetical protein
MTVNDVLRIWKEVCFKASLTTKVFGKGAWEQPKASFRTTESLIQNNRKPHLEQPKASFRTTESLIQNNRKPYSEQPKALFRTTALRAEILIRKLQNTK